jgi:hypothetical protein
MKEKLNWFGFVVGCALGLIAAFCLVYLIVVFL